MRIRKRNEFAAVLDNGSRAADMRLIVFVAPNNLAYPRLGISVPKRFGKAYRRNRVRRLLREAFRLRQHQLPSGVDIICIIRPAGRTKLTLKDYDRSFIKLVDAAYGKLERCEHD